MLESHIRLGREKRETNQLSSSVVVVSLFLFLDYRLSQPTHMPPLACRSPSTCAFARVVKARERENRAREKEEELAACSGLLGFYLPPFFLVIFSSLRSCLSRRVNGVFVELMPRVPLYFCGGCFLRPERRKDNGMNARLPMCLPFAARERDGSTSLFSLLFSLFSCHSLLPTRTKRTTRGNYAMLRKR